MMQPQQRPRGRPRKKRKTKKVQDTRERSRAPSPSPHRARPLENVDDDDDNTSDTGDPELWDPHAGLKPSQLDGRVSDGEIEIEDDLPYGGEKELNSTMIDMMLDLGDYDERDGEWLPPKERKKLEARKKGSQCFEDVNIKTLTKIIRQEEDSLPWARRFHEGRKNTTTPPPRSCDEESITTHRSPVHQVAIPVVPFGLGLFVASVIQGRVEGSIGGVVSRAIGCPIPRTLFLRGFLARPFAIVAARI